MRQQGGNNQVLFWYLVGLISLTFCFSPEIINFYFSVFWGGYLLIHLFDITLISVKGFEGGGLLFSYLNLFDEYLGDAPMF